MATAFHLVFVTAAIRAIRTASFLPVSHFMSSNAQVTLNTERSWLARIEIVLKRKFFYWLTSSNFLYIIVLLILAAVSIATLTGENGILTRASDAKIENSHATIKEAILLAYNEYQTQINISDTKETVKVASMQRVTIQGQEENRLATTGTSFITTSHV